MTVSPRWPQDDTPRPFDAGNGLAADAPAAGSMPPTLFRLPRLSTPPKSPVPVQEVSNQQVSIPLAEVVPPQFTTPTAPQKQVAPPISDPVVEPIDQTLEADSQGQAPGFPDLYSRSADAPAGRSWMEVARQHGIVVMLLLVVVATAVFTGRDSNPDDSDASIANVIEFNGMDSDVVADAGKTPYQPDFQPAIESSAETVAARVSADTVAAVPAVENVSETTAPTASVATLEFPRAATNANLTPSDSGREELGQTAQFSPPLDAKTVSDRNGDYSSADSDVVFNPPSLEVLENSLSENQPATSANSVAGQSRPDVPILSKTPAGISDWSRYLPELPTAPRN